MSQLGLIRVYTYAFTHTFAKAAESVPKAWLPQSLPPAEARAAHEAAVVAARRASARAEQRRRRSVESMRMI